MNESKLIEIIHRSGPTGGREEAAKTAFIAGGELAKLAEPIRHGKWPSHANGNGNGVAHVNVRDVNRAYCDGFDKSGGDFSVAIAQALVVAKRLEDPNKRDWAIKKIQDGLWDPNYQRPKGDGDGAGVDTNNGRLEPPIPKHLWEPRQTGKTVRNGKTARSGGKAGSDKRKRERSAEDKNLRARMKGVGGSREKKEKRGR